MPALLTSTSIRPKARFVSRDDFRRGFLHPDIGDDFAHLGARHLLRISAHAAAMACGVKVDQHDARTFLAEQPPGRHADAARAARDDRHLSVQPSHALP